MAICFVKVNNKFQLVEYERDSNGNLVSFQVHDMTKGLEKLALASKNISKTAKKLHKKLKI